MHVKDDTIQFTFVSDFGKIVDDLFYENSINTKSQSIGKLAIKTISKISNIQIVDNNESTGNNKRRNLNKDEDLWGLLTFETEDNNSLFFRMFTIDLIAQKSSPISSINF